MLILHIINSLDRGGAENSLYKLIKKKKCDTNFIVISLTTKGAYGLILEKMGVPVYELGFKSIATALPAFLKLIFLLRKLKPNIVQTWLYHADLIGGLASWFASEAKVLWGIRSYDLKKSGSYITRIVQRLCALLSYVIPIKILCVAESSKKIHVALGYDSNKFVVIPNGFEITSLRISAKSIENLRDELGLALNSIAVGSIGRFSPAKDHHNFIQACSLVAGQVPKVRFVMVGRGLDANNPVLADWLAESGVADRFILLGERDDVPMLLSLMDIFCSSSRTEAFPNVVGEAMVQSRPCVVTDVGDTRFLVGDTAIVVPPENSQALAEGLLKVLKLSSSERTAMGRRGHERISSEFSFSKTLGLIEAVYAEVLMQKNK
jgi:glycosyltransferase involved in cell wall biosynthesis